MNSKTKMRTATCMIYASGTGTATYGTFRGPMKGKAFNLNKADQVGSFTTAERPNDELYRRLTAQHATAEAPAVSWQA